MARKLGSGSFDKTLSVNVDSKMFEVLNTMSVEKKMTLSAYVRFLLGNLLKDKVA
jgi:hypothetical protein